MNSEFLYNYGETRFGYFIPNIRRATFSSWLKTILEFQEVNETELGRRLGFTRQRVYFWTKDHDNQIPSEENIEKIAAAIGVDKVILLIPFIVDLQKGKSGRGRE
jgi:transcriptional regulator with XRE-family HTH domain